MAQLCRCWQQGLTPICSAGLLLHLFLELRIEGYSCICHAKGVPLSVKTFIARLFCACDVNFKATKRFRCSPECTLSAIAKQKYQRSKTRGVVVLSKIVLRATRNLHASAFQCMFLVIFRGAAIAKYWLTAYLMASMVSAAKGHWLGMESRLHLIRSDRLTFD